MGIRKRKWVFAKTITMKNIVITGKIGTGKTRLAKKICRNCSSHCVYINVDDLAKIFLPGFLRRQKNFSTKSELKRILFFASPKIQQKTWNDLEKYIHPRVQEEIFSIQKFFRYKNIVLVWDVALAEKFFFGDTYVVSVPMKPLYSHVFSLKKYRKISYREIFGFLRRQGR